MRCLGKLLGLGLVITFVMVWPLSIWTYNTQRIVLDVDTYKNLFDDKDFYAELVPGVLPALLEGQDQPAPPPGEVALLDVINNLDDHTWANIAPELVPVEWVEYEVETNLDTFLTWLEGDRDDLVLVFHTDPLRRRLADSPGELTINRIIEAMPPCDPTQEREFEAFTGSEPNAAFPYCRPNQPDLRDDLHRILDDARRNAVGDLQTDLDVIHEMEVASQEHTQDQEKVFTRPELDRFRSGVRLWRNLLALYLLVPAALLSLVVIIAIRSSKTFFRWMGWSLMISSLFALVPFVFLPLIVSDLHVEAELREGFATGGDLIAEVVGQRLIRLLIGAFTWPILIQSALLIGIGFAGVVLSVLLNDPDAPPEVIAAAVPAVQDPEQ